jgi:hypothetical protein
MFWYDPPLAAVIGDRSSERFYGPPEGALENRATIASANEQEVCVRVELRRGVNPLRVCFAARARGRERAGRLNLRDVVVDARGEA